MQISSSESSQAAAAPTGKLALKQGKFSVWLVVALAAFVGGVLGLVFQQPHPDPTRVVTPWTSLDWWKNPIEQNAFKRLPVVSGNINNIFALPDGKHLWAVGSGGLILHSGDGGKNWQQQTDVELTAATQGRQPVDEPKPASKDKASQHKPLFDLIPSVQAGEPNAAQTPVQKDIRARPVPNKSPPTNYPPVTVKPTLPEPKTNNDVGTTQPANIAPGEAPPKPLALRDINLNAVSFVDASRGWAVGDGGTILATDDGGKTWRAQTSGTNTTLISVHFVDASRGWAVGGSIGPSTILATDDGGKTWRAQTSGTSQWLRSVHFVDASRGWAVGDDGAILATDDGGKTWRAQTSGTKTWLESVHFVDASRGWVVGGSIGAITILATDDGGKTWRTQTSGMKAQLTSVHFFDASRGWAVGDGGTILATDDGGKTWHSPKSGTAMSLSSISGREKGQRLCIVGDGTILNSRDGGKTWQSIDYDRQPAPWVWALWLSSAYSGWRAWLRVRNAPAKEKERSIEDKGASDAPVETGDQDRLNFAPVAQALSKFLQNAATTAPLVLAVTGKWGTGKSSLMNLLRDELRAKFGVRAVWFNAWHHQNEEHLLSALLENIRQQAVPPLHTPAGWLFRVRLACMRYQRRFVSSSAMLAILLTAGAYIYRAPTERWDQFIAWIKMFTMTDVDKLGSASVIPGVSGLAVLGVIAKLLLGLRAFGANPAALMASTSNQFKVRDASAQAGFRFQFQRDFQEVTNALEQINARMLIFIDDLDRCQPEKSIADSGGREFSHQFRQLLHRAGHGPRLCRGGRGTEL